MLKNLIAQQKLSIDHFFTHLDLQKFEQLIDLAEKCQGKILFSGVGKSGLIAKKISLTMTSIATRSFYLSPTNALHGDIGFVNPGDVFMLLSKSGETEELLNLLPYIRNKQAHTVAIVSNPESRLAKGCDTFLELPLNQELCPMNLVPTTSGVLQNLFGDLLAVELMERKKFSLESYALNHPAGRIGRRMTLKVEDLMLTGSATPICHPDDKLIDRLSELSNKKCGCLLVIDDTKHLHGIFTDGDLRRVLQNLGAKALESTIKDLMNRTPRHISPKKLAWEALQMMESDQKSPITILPVLNEQSQVTGLIRLHDLLQAGVN